MVILPVTVKLPLFDWNRSLPSPLVTLTLPIVVLPPMNSELLPSPPRTVSVPVKLGGVHADNVIAELHVNPDAGHTHKRARASASGEDFAGVADQAKIPRT